MLPRLSHRSLLIGAAAAGCATSRPRIEGNAAPGRGAGAGEPSDAAGDEDVHTSWNLSVVLAGLPGAFARGQGRHLVTPPRSTGDLWAKVLRMLGGSEGTFGATGTIGSHAAELGVTPPIFAPGDARPGTTADTPLHLGDLDP